MTARGIAGVLLALLAASCAPGDANVAAPGICTLEPVPSTDGLLKATDDCARDAKGLAAAVTQARERLGSGAEIALGQVPFEPNGVFDRCAIMARLADDPLWISSGDSGRLARPLQHALQSGALAPSIAEALAGAGRKLRSVSVETVLLSGRPATGCAKGPSRAPAEAQVWLALD